MKTIISPAKKMNADPDGLPPRGLPEFLDRAETLRDYLRGLSYPELKRLLACNDRLAELNYERYQRMELRRGLTPAILAYEGIQYQYMAPGVFTAGEYEYVERHLRILSGLYGILRPFDGVTPYRLEMQAKLRTEFCGSLYDYWGDSLAAALAREDDTVLDLASEEYSRAVAPRLGAGVRRVKAVFGQRVGGRVVEKGVYVKMARGELVRWMAGRGVEDVEEIRAFDGLGYRYDPELSDGDAYVFLKE